MATHKISERLNVDTTKRAVMNDVDKRFVTYANKCIRQRKRAEAQFFKTHLENIFVDNLTAMKPYENIATYINEEFQQDYIETTNTAYLYLQTCKQTDAQNGFREDYNEWWTTTVQHLLPRAEFLNQVLITIVTIRLLYINYILDGIFF